MSDEIWAMPGYAVCFGYVEALADGPKQARQLLGTYLPRLAGQQLGGGLVVIAVGLDREERGRPIPHLGYRCDCAGGCQHPVPPPGLQAWRFFGLWLLVAGTDDTPDGWDAIESGPLRIEVVGRRGRRTLTDKEGAEP
jgi:hypothetical protein